jgi:hypothetical protein
VKHGTVARFWRHYAELPKEIRELADKNFKLLKENPRHPSLHLKRVGEFWAVRVGLDSCALGVDDTDRIVWFWVGPHGEYEKWIAGKRQQGLRALSMAAKIVLPKKDKGRAGTSHH